MEFCPGIGDERELHDMGAKIPGEHAFPGIARTYLQQISNGDLLFSWILNLVSIFQEEIQKWLVKAGQAALLKSKAYKGGDVALTHRLDI